jgi:hypothetical protein
MRRTVITTTVVLGAFLAGSGALASPAGVPPQDAFKGRITGGTGAWADANGRVSISILAEPSTTSTRAVTLAVHGKTCGTKARCLQLRGRLHGTLSPGPQQNPDAGRAFELNAHGKLTPLRRVHATGTVHGTGFIAQGRETMELTVRNRRGSVTIGASSGLVPGFTGP